jgi:hypothetical protein
MDLVGWLVIIRVDSVISNSVFMHLYVLFRFQVSCGIGMNPVLWHVSVLISK